MKLPSLQLLRTVRSSYWFVPSVMVVIAIIVGALAVWLDSGPASDLFDGIGWYQKSKPEGAREVLSTIAGSMITVAGVVFSITIVAISFAANQYGPRILTNFMANRGNQVTLGTFIATFVYSIVVLRTIYAGEEAFVPQLAVMIAMVLALCSILVLIYFIHHVPQSIHINTITSQVGRQLIDSIDERFPACFGDPPEQPEEQQDGFARMVETAFGSGGDYAQISCNKDGYLQAVDDGRLVSAARNHDLLICVKRSPGHFLFRGRTIALAWPASRVTGEAAEDIRSSWSLGSRRTPGQDILFLIDELVEIGGRALSTGVNDPYTAMTCLDWLSAAAAELARRQPPSPYRLDDDGKLRVVAPSGTLKVHLERGFGRMRPYVARDVNAAGHFASSLGSLAGQCGSMEQVEAMASELEALAALAASELEGPSLELVEKEVAAARAKLVEARSRLSGHAHEPIANARAPGPSRSRRSQTPKG
jgi:uncharacterized membrane protein